MLSRQEIKVLIGNNPSLCFAIANLLNKREKEWGCFRVRKEEEFFSLYIPSLPSFKLYQKGSTHLYKGYWIDKGFPDLSDYRKYPPAIRVRKIKTEEEVRNNKNNISLKNKTIDSGITRQELERQERARRQKENLKEIQERRQRLEAAKEKAEREKQEKTAKVAKLEEAGIIPKLRERKYKYEEQESRDLKEKFSTRNRSDFSQTNRSVSVNKKKNTKIIRNTYQHITYEVGYRRGSYDEGLINIVNRLLVYFIQEAISESISDASTEDTKYFVLSSEIE